MDLTGTRMMAVEIQTEPSFSSEIPEVLFERRFPIGGGISANFDVASDGRLLVVKEQPENERGTGASEIDILVNWFQELTERVPTN